MTVRYDFAFSFSIHAPLVLRGIPASEGGEGL